MIFRRFDAGAGQGARHKRADCTVRALAVATGLSYSRAWQKLYALQGEFGHCHFDLFHYLRTVPSRLGVVRYLSFPAKRGQRRMTAQTFVDSYPTGNFIVQVAHHSTVVQNGVLIDTWNCGRKAVYGAWEIKPLEEQKA